MLSSKELMAAAGISRATLNNYIAAGLLPRPQVVRPDPAAEEARRLGYFPDEAVRRLQLIAEYKRQGVSMNEIAYRLAASPASAPEDAATGSPTASTAGPLPALTFDRIDGPAYFVNTRFEVEWYNEAARDRLFGRDLAGDIRQRNLFDCLLTGAQEPDHQGLAELLGFHLGIARRRLSKDGLMASVTVQGERRALIEGLFAGAQPVEGNAIRSLDVDLAPIDRPSQPHRVSAAFFREGTVFAYAPEATLGDALLDLLARRDTVIRELLRRRQPYVTPVAALVADLEGSMRICAGLPPEEYFELINGMWSAMEPVLRRHRATVGKHAGDGLVCYFFPQPDGSHVANAVRCALAMREVMAGIDRAWQARKNWATRLQLNYGIDEGEEWFGTFQSASHIQFTVLGDTVNRAARLSDFASGGSVWVTKNLIGKLSAEERDGLRWGIRRGADAPLVAATYARVCDIADLAAQPKLADIATLPIAEIVGAQPPRS